MSLINKIKNKLIKPIHIAIDDIENTFFDETHWHYHKSAIAFSGEQQVIQMESKANQVSYVNFLAAGTNFSKIEPHQNKLILEERNSILIKGKAAKSLSYIIYLIEYNEQNKQIKKHTIRLNKMKSFVKQKDTVSARLAIRIAGKGKMKISGFFASPFIPVPTVKKESVTNLKDIRIAGILSEDALVSLSDVSSPYALSINTWQEELEREVPEFVFIESSEITDSDWRIESKSVLHRLFLWCQTSDIPIVFWHRQAETETEQFTAVSKKADMIITHDVKQAGIYREWTTPEKVELTPVPIRAYQPEKALQEQHMEKNRSMLWRNNPKDFICFLLMRFNIKYISSTPTVTMYAKAHTKEEFDQVIQTIESQTIQDVKWILFIMPFPGYEQAMNQYMEKIEIHIHSYVLRYRFLKHMVSTTYFGILRSPQVQNEFFLEDVIHWLDYQPSNYLEIINNQHQVTAEFYLKQKYIKKRLKELIPVEVPRENLTSIL